MGILNDTFYASRAAIPYVVREEIQDDGVLVLDNPADDDFKKLGIMTHPTIRKANMVFEVRSDRVVV